MCARTCKYCSNEFTGRSDKIYCSRKCKNKAKRKPYGYFKWHQAHECNKCGFVPVHPCQLDIDHINGIKSDNREENLQILCANCHRLKTWINKDYQK